MASDVIKSSDRKTIITICVCFIAFAALTPSVTGIVNRVNKIGKDLKNDLSEVLQLAVVNYTDPNNTYNYVSKINTNMRGMVPLYDITRKAIDLIQTKEAYPEGYLTISDGHVELKPLSESWKDLLLHYSGVLIVGFLIALYGILIFLIGFCFCCCRCAGSCGGSNQPYDTHKKYDKCKKVILALLLIGIVTLFMFGIVCVFVTNQHMHDSTVELPTTTRTSIEDVRLYLNATNDEFTWILEKNFDELQKKLLGLIHSSGMKISAHLEIFSGAVSVTTLNNMVKDLDRVRYNLETIQNITKRLQANAGRLDDRLRKVKNDLLQTLNRCNASQCRSILAKYNINELKTEIHHTRLEDKFFPELPNVTGLLENITDILNGDIRKEVNEGHEKFNNIKRQIEDTVNRQIPTLEAVLSETGTEIRNLSRQITEEIQHLDSLLKRNGDQGVDQAARYIDEYAKYRWQVGLGAGLVLLVVLISACLGLTCGVCDSRPHGYSDDCCNRGTGASFLMFGVSIMFLLGIVLAALMLLHFAAGVITQRAVCDSLNDPQNSRLFGHMNDFVNLEYLLYGTNEEPDFTLSSVIGDCQKNESLYQVLHLYRRINLDEMKEKLERELQEKIEMITQQTNFESSRFTILSERAKASLLRLSDSGLSTFRFDTITDKLVTNITSIDLPSLSRQLQEKANEIGPKSELQQIKRSLEDAADSLERCQVEVVDKILEDIKQLNATAMTEILDDVHFNRSSFSEAVRYLLDKTSTAETYLSEQGPEDIRNLTQEFAEGVAGMVSVYLTRVVNKIKVDVGKCGPVSNVYNVTVNSVCAHIVMPFNGYWIALGWCLLLFIPMIIVSVKLSTLYRKSDAYPGPHVEAECLYDASADLDSIPLANPYADRLGGSEKQRSRVSRGERGVARGSGGPPSDSSDANNSRRYHDMAPKQWNERPPRYHGPAEYERPPPYYYPGTSDRE